VVSADSAAAAAVSAAADPAAVGDAQRHDFYSFPQFFHRYPLSPATAVSKAMRGSRNPMRYAARLLPAILVLVLCASCDRPRERSAHGFRPPEASPNLAAFYDSETSIVDSLALPAFLNKQDAVLVTTRDTVGGRTTGRSFDRIELFSRDPRDGSYKSVFIDPVDNGVSVELRDITGDGRPDILVRTLASAADTVEARGLSVYALLGDDRFTLVFQSESGAPALLDIPGMRGKAIRVLGSYAGRFSGVGAVIYLSGIHVFNGTSFGFSDSLTAAAALHKLEALERVMKALNKKNAVSSRDADQLYETAVGMLLQSEVAGSRMTPSSIWLQYKSILQKRLGAEKFQDLESLINDQNAESNDAPRQL
jgi:hypothetical protein